MRFSFAAIFLLSSALALGAQEVPLKNPSFEKGLAGWDIRFSEKTYKKSPVSAEAPGSRGRRAACVNAVHSSSQFVFFQTVALEPGRYEFSGSIKIDASARWDPSSAPECTRLFAAKTRPGIASDVKYNYTVAAGKKLPGGWRRSTVRFSVWKREKRFRVGLQVAGIAGKVRFDDAALRRIPAKPLPNDGLWFDDATWLDDGLTTRQRLFDMLEAKSPFIERAQNYNDHLVDAARLCDEIDRLAVADRYLGRKSDPAVRKRMDRIMETFDRANRTFTEIYIRRSAGDLPAKVDPLLAEIERELGSLTRDVRARLAARLAEVGLKPYVAPPPVPYRLSPEGKANQIMFGNWGKFEWKPLGRKLGVWRLASHCGANCEPRADGTLDWSAALRNYDRLKEIGVDFYGVRTWIFSHMNTIFPPAFLAKNKTDPDVFNPKRVRKPDKPYLPLNQWNPKVRKMQIELVRDMARTLKGHGILFYHYAWENRGPMDIPYNPKTPPEKASGLASFRAFLQKRHGTIDALNKAWRTGYGSFEEIVPPAKKAPWPNANPLGFEYQLWRHDTHIENMRALYRAWKSEDPATPVLAAHSKLFHSVDPTRIFETADIMEFHSRWDKLLAAQEYLADNAPLVGKQICSFENWSALQEETGRFGDERAMFAQNAKCAYRYGLWGIHMSFWTFPYTSQPSWMWRQGQWAKLNSDYCLMRYSATAIPVAKARLKRMEKTLLGLRQAPSKVLLVYPRTSWLHQPTGRAVRHQIEPMVKLLHARGRPFDFRPETRLVSGQDKLADYKVIILPWAPFLPDGLGRMLLSWTRAGGLLVCLGPAGVFDKYGFGDGTLMKNTLGFVPKATGSLREKYMSWNFGDLKAEGGVVKKRAGKGMILLTTETLWELLERPEAGGKLLAEINAAAPPPVVVTGSPLEVWCLRDKKGARLLGFVNADVDRPARSNVTVRGGWEKVFDLDFPGGFPVPARRTQDGLRFDLELPPAGMTLLRLE